MPQIEKNLNKRFSLEPLAKMDQSINQHSVRVSRLCIAIGNAMGLSTEDIKRLRTIGLLHDIGKSTLPASILAKPASLTEEEFEVIRLHPLIGANLLEVSGYEKPIVQGVRNHHERLDGSGYPRGIKEYELDLMSRIVAVADVYEAMTSDRPYRKALPETVAIIQLKQYDQFDQDVTSALVSFLYSQGFTSYKQRRPKARPPVDLRPFACPLDQV